MVRSRPTLPAGHGELLEQPPYTAWADTIAANREAAAARNFTIASVPYGELRSLAREEALAVAGDFSMRLGVPVRPLRGPEAPLVMTGHQPELYHSGVWVKDFLLQRISDETGASAIDVVVDSDGFDRVGVTAPCTAPVPRRCRQYLAIGRPDTWYAQAPVPDERALADFCAAGDSLLATLSAPSVRRHFSEFCSALLSASDSATNLAELVTFARRRYEARAGTDYAELPVTALVKGQAFSTFVADLALDATRFADAYNNELDEYRALSRTRSAAQPFPNLALEGEAVELPLWAFVDGSRHTIWAIARTDGAELRAGGRTLASLPFDGPRAAARVRGLEGMVAPKALTLTLFLRLFCCDLFIHGVGGGRYDRVTDGVCRRYYGVEPPAFAVASLTMYLPLGAHVIAEEEIAAAKERLARLEHNPDVLLGEVEFDSADEQQRAALLATEKATLVSAISVDGADKKTLGRRIREVNSELAAILAPLKAQYSAQVESLEQQRLATEILTDRNYPFCFWSPEEIADKVR